MFRLIPALLLLCFLTSEAFAATTCTVDASYDNNDNRNEYRVVQSELLGTFDLHYSYSYDKRCELNLDLQSDVLADCSIAEKENLTREDDVDEYLTVRCRVLSPGLQLLNPLTVSTRERGSTSEYRKEFSAKIWVWVPLRVSSKSNVGLIVSPIEWGHPVSVLFIFLLVLGLILGLVPTTLLVIHDIRPGNSRRCVTSPETDFKNSTDKLRNYVCLTSLDFQLFYDELSASFKAYLAKKFSIPTFEMTTPQVVRSLRGELPRDYVKFIEELLRFADHIKFSATVSDHEFHEDILSALDTFVGNVQRYCEGEITNTFSDSEASDIRRRQDNTTKTLLPSVRQKLFLKRP